MDMGSIEYNTVEDIKIYTGDTLDIRGSYMNNIRYLRNLVTPYEKIFTILKPSTLTAQGFLSNVSFNEEFVGDRFPQPTGDIMLVGCNFWEKFNVNYVKKPPVIKSTRGRKPNPKEGSKRRVQGSGKYFSSQITVVIRDFDSATDYKFKVFRNGSCQAPGAKRPDMLDLIKPLKILQNYLNLVFNDVKIVSLTAVMRNYKSRLINKNFHVDLETLESKILKEKSQQRFIPYVHYILRSLNPNIKEKALKYIGKKNNLNIAEITYNNDRCFCLILKLYRPMPNDKDKKTTVKLLKKGKINFDGGNSEYETLELYHWLEYIYSLYKDEILVDITKIKNAYNEEEIKKINIADIIYSDDEK
jgi:hypothetical protein